MCKKHVHKTKSMHEKPSLLLFQSDFPADTLVSILTMRNVGVLVLGELEGESGTKVD